MAGIAIAAFSSSAFGQATSPNRNTEAVQPKIMVIPFVKENEDLRTVLEADFKKRDVITSVKDGFDKRGFTTKDFVATLKEAKDAKLFNSNTQSDVKSALVEFSGADIYVEVEYSITQSSPRGKIASVILHAYDVATGNSYADARCNSGERYDTDDGTLINVAVSTPPPTYGDKPSSIPCLDGFLNSIQAKFTDMVAKGRAVKVDFSLDATAARNFDSKININGKQQALADVIDDWLADHSYKNNYHLQGGTPTRLFYDDVRIPVFDERGRNYKLNKFGQELTDFLTSKGITAKRATKNGGLFVTINN
jgi:hypothetical protein